MNDKPTAIFLMGPTASGKTDIAVQLVQDLPVEIISVDSAMVYRGMDIGTAKPNAAVLARAPHHLIDICDAAEPYSAAQFSEDARNTMAEITSRGKIPLLVGGTFLYFRALYEGLSALPEADANLRLQLEAEAQLLGWAGLHQRLADIDPESAAKIHPNDPQRIQRALEVYGLTGETMSSLQRREKSSDFPYRVLKLVVAPSERAELHERIAIRFNHMLDIGLLDEVRYFFERQDMNKHLPSMRAVGYRQVWSYLQGELQYPEMIQKGIVATRQFAKRQFTWLRSDDEAIWFDALTNDIYSQIRKKILVNLEQDTTL